jgi:site-specific recombinase XerC
LGKYSYGKKEELMPFQVVKSKVLSAELHWRDEAFFWLLYYCGVRKSEAYERVASDFKITESRLIIDFHQRKKRGAEVPPLELPLHWFGLDKIMKIVQLATKSHPRQKAVYIYENKKRVRILKEGKWVFPNIQSTKAWEIVQQVLGEEYYPHFLRLNRLTEIGQDPTASLTRLKSFSGIKSTTALNTYLGTSKKEQQKAIEYMNKKYG